ncbi:MAG: transporter [Marinirhabdus sp.]
MQKFFTTLSALLFCVAPLTAQYTETINSNRPGFSQGAFSVGNGVLQLEGGVGYGTEKHRLLNTETTGYLADYAIRYGFLFEELEVSFMGTYQSNAITDTRVVNGTPFYNQNFKGNTLGLKYLVYDPYIKRTLQGPNLYSWKANNRTQWRDLVPAVALYAGLNFETAENPFTPGPGSSINPKVVLATQNNFLGGWVFVTNIIADRLGTDFPTYGYIATLTHAFTPRFSGFVENQGFKSDFYADQLLRGGLAYLFHKGFQIDASLTFNLKDTPELLYGRLGASYRFDFHAGDDFLEEKGRAGKQTRKENKAKARAKKKTKEKQGKEGDSTDDGDGGSTNGTL